MVGKLEAFGHWLVTYGEQMPILVLRLETFAVWAQDGFHLFALLD